MHSIRRMALPIIGLTSAHLSYLILSMFLVSYPLFCEFIRKSPLLCVPNPPLATLCRHSSLVPEGIVSLIRTDGDWEDEITQGMAWMVVGVQSLCHPVGLPKKYIKI